MVSNFKKRFLTSLALIILIFLIFTYNYILVSSLLILGIFSLLEFSNIIKKVTKSALKNFLINFIFINYVFVFSITFYYFTNFLNTKIILFLILMSCISSDIGGYIFGKVLKGPKLTKISPNKTISGAIGSLFFSCLIISLLFYFITKNIDYSIVMIGIFTSIGCQIGDLFFSFLKRKAKIKDTGNFFPGHGGVLDRLDGIFFGIPIGYLSLILFY
tara:strand:- start:6746 stop:7393 length:648 start_codon:yes stop_codon:yes gene_type:complete